MKENRTTEKEYPGNASGRWVVTVLLGAGLIAGAGSVYYWMNHVKIKPRDVNAEPSDQPDQPSQSNSSPLNARRLTHQNKKDAEWQEKQLEDLSTALNRLKGDLSGHFALVRDIESFAASNPSNAGGHKLLGMVRMYQREFKQAYDAFARSLVLLPDQDELQLLAGSNILKLGEMAIAEKHYQAVLKEDPTHTRAIVHLAILRFRQDREQEAEKLLEQALDKDAQMHEAHYRLGMLLSKLDPPEVDRAVRHIDRAIELSVSSQKDIRPVYWITKSKILRQHGYSQESLRFLVNVVSQKDIKNHPMLLHEMAQCHGDHQRYNEAAQVYERQIRIQPFEWRLHANAAQWRLQAGDKSSVRRHIAAIRRINPRAPIISKLEAALEAPKVKQDSG